MIDFLSSDNSIKVQVDFLLDKYLLHLEKPNLDNISLMQGASGITYFLANLYCKSSEDLHLSLYEKNFNHLIDIVNRKESVSHSFCDGYAGFGWMLSKLNQMDLLPEAYSDFFFGKLDQYLFDCLVACVNNGHWDYLHGGLGIIKYFLIRENCSFKKKAIEIFLTFLDKDSEKDKHGRYWIDRRYSRVSNDDSNVYINLGMAHGLPSIIIMLCQIYEAGYMQGLIKDLLDSCTNWLLHHQNPEFSKSRFPYRVAYFNADYSQDSRLAWCYGDLGIAKSLINYGNLFDNTAIRSFALDIIDKSGLRNIALESKNIDKGLCHGIFGISYQFYKFYQISGNNVCKNASIKWLEIGFSNPENAEGDVSSKSGSISSLSDTPEEGLLEGMCGIALALSTINSSISSEWDDCLLLS